MQLIKIMSKLPIQVAFQLRSADHDGLIDPLNKTEMKALSDVLKTKMKHNQLEWCLERQYIQYLNEVRSKPVNALYTVTIRLHEMKADSFYDVMHNLMEVPIVLRVNGQMMNISLVLYHSALDINKSPVYKFSDNIANIPTSHAVYESETPFTEISLCQFSYDIHISKLTFCEQVILKRADIIPENTKDGSRIFLISRNRYLYDFVVDIDNNIRICVDDFMHLETTSDTNDPQGTKDINDTHIIFTKGMSFLGLFVDVLFLTSAIVALCLCKELPKDIKLQNLQLVINLQLIQILLLISIILSISGTICAIVGLCVHFLSLSVQFIASMSYKVSSSLSSFTTPLKQYRKMTLSFLKPHFLAAALVSVTTCYAVYYSDVGELGYGSWMKLCFITDNFHRILSLLVPLGVAASAIVYTVITTIFEKGRGQNPNTPKNLEYKPMLLCVCLLNLLTWLSEYFFMDTPTSLAVFVSLNSIQCIFLAVCLITICWRLSHHPSEVSMM